MTNNSGRIGAGASNASDSNANTTDDEIISGELTPVVVDATALVSEAQILGSSSYLSSVDPQNVRTIAFHITEASQRHQVERAFKLLNYFGLAQKEISRCLNIYAAEISQFCNGRRRPTLGVVCGLRDMLKFGVPEASVSKTEAALTAEIIWSLEMIIVGADTSSVIARDYTNTNKPKG